MKKYVVDTNVILNNVEVIKRPNIIITSMVLREIENLELKKADRGLQFQIREAKREIKKQLKNKSEVSIVDISDFEESISGDYSKDYADNIIVQYALKNEFGIVTNDILMELKAVSLGIEVLSGDEFCHIEGEDNDYTGFIIEKVSREKFTEIYLNLQDNCFELKVNQYLVLIDDETEDVMDVFKWTGEYLISIGNRKGDLHKQFTTTQFSTFQTKDEYQVMALDSIENNQLTMVRGKAGSGKSLIALNTAWRLVEEKEYKLVIFFNPAPSKDATEMGFYKGDMLEKAMQSSLGSMLKSKFGDINEVLDQIAKGNIEMLPFVDLRGYDTGERDTVVWITESQNLTSELLKMGLQRIAENTKVIIDGDFHQQVDKEIYANDNGMRRVSEVFRGVDLYGEIELQNIYRSRIADIADKM